MSWWLTSKTDVFRFGARLRTSIGELSEADETEMLSTVRARVRESMSDPKAVYGFIVVDMKACPLVVYPELEGGAVVGVVDFLVWHEEEITQGEFVGKKMRLPDVLVGKIKPPGVTVN